MSGSISKGGVVKRGGFRLSPNEEAAVIKEEEDRRRKQRLKQDDARQAAKEEDERMREEGEKLQADLRERKEKAMLRHKHAKEKELLKQDYDRLLLDLSDLQNADRRRRQAVVADIPRQVFQPPHRRLEDKAEKQHELEEAFEDMYMKHTDYAGDITLALEPKVPGQDTDLDLTADTTRDGEEEDQSVTLERPGLSREGPSTQFRDGSSSETAERVEHDPGATSKPVSARAEMLKKLMGRVRGQQEDWKRQQTKTQTPVASGLPQVTPETQMQEEDVTTSPESQGTESHLSIETSPAQTQTTPSELSEYPIAGSVDNGSSAPSSLPRSLETGALSELSSEAGSTLLHPMERAAKLRGDQIAQQTKTQEDIRAIGHEQQKRLEDLKQSVHVPWDDIGLSRLPTVPPEQHGGQMDGTGQSLHPGYVGGNMPEMLELEHGGFPHPAPDTEFREMLQTGVRLSGTAAKHPWSRGNIDSGQAQRNVDQNLYEPDAYMPQSAFSGSGRGEMSQSFAVDDPDGMVLMNWKPAVVEERLSNQQTSAEQSIDRQLLDEVVHHVPLDAQATQDGGTSIDWLQRAREYQQRLLDRQKQSQDSLLQAQMKLQERRERLMKNYPDVKLPDYTPYTMQNEMESTGVQSIPQYTSPTIPTVDKFQGITLPKYNEQGRYETRASFKPGNTSQQHTQEQLSPSVRAEGGPLTDNQQRQHNKTPEYQADSRVSPSKRRLYFSQGEDQDIRDSHFGPMAEEAASDVESNNHTLERQDYRGDMSAHMQQQAILQPLLERSGGTPDLPNTSSQTTDRGTETAADVALKIRHQQLLEEKRILEERQKTQQLRLMQKQKELADQIEQQQRRYQERMKSADFSAPSVPQPKGPPVEHSPSIPQGILRGSGVGSHSPETELSMGKLPMSSSEDMIGSSSKHSDLRRMMQGQVFRPQDLLHHVQASQNMEAEDESDRSHRSSLGGTQEAGHMMMGVLKPHELLPHLQTRFTDSDGSTVPHDVSSSSTGFLQEQSLQGTHQSGQSTQAFELDHSQPEFQHPSMLSEGTLESSASSSLQPPGDRSLGQVFRPAELMAELNAIKHQVGMQGSFGSSNEFAQSKSAELVPTIESGRSSGSYSLGAGSGTHPFAGSLQRQTRFSDQSAELHYQSLHGTGELSGTTDGPKGIYRDLLQGQVFRPEGLLPHLQDHTTLSHTLDGSSMTEPQLSSTLAHSESLTSHHRPEGDGSGANHLDQPLARLSLTHEDDTIQAASPDLNDQDLLHHDQPQGSIFLPMTTPTHPPSGSHFMRLRRPPPANLQQVAMLPENMGPHELSTILETETSADERMHLYGVGATPRNVMELSKISNADERDADHHFMSGTLGNLGERLPTFGGPATAEDSDLKIDLKRKEIARKQEIRSEQHGTTSTGPLIQMAHPTIASYDYEELELFDDCQGPMTPHSVADLQGIDSTAAASTISEYTLDDESNANASIAEHSIALMDSQRRLLTGKNFVPLGLLGVHRGEPAGESMKWKDLLKSSDDSPTSSNSAGLETAQKDSRHHINLADSDADEFLPMMETQNTTTATQDSIHDHTISPAHTHLGQTGANYVNLADSEADEFLPMMVTQNTTTATQDSIHDHTISPAHTHLGQTGATQMQKHLAAGLNLDSSTSSEGPNNGQTPRILSQGELASTSSSSKLSTVIAAGAGRASSGPATDEDSPLFVPKSSQQHEKYTSIPPGTQTSGLSMRDHQRMMVSQSHFDRGSIVSSEDPSDDSLASTTHENRQHPSIPLLTPHQTIGSEGASQVFRREQDREIAASQEEYIKNMLASLQYGTQKGITMPLFSDVSLSGYSMSQDGSVSESRPPVRPNGKASLERTPAGSSHLDDQSLPSLSDIQLMEPGIMEEPDLTFASSLDTTADLTLQAPGPREDPPTLDVSQSSQASISMSLLSFQQHERDLLDTSPRSDPRVTLSEGQLKVARDTSSSTHVRVTQSEGQVKVAHEAASPGQLTSAKQPSSSGQLAAAKQDNSSPGESYQRTTGPVSLQEAFQQRKKAFIQASESRKREVKEHAESRSQDPTAFAKTIQDWKRSKVKVQKKQATTNQPIGASASGLMSTLVTPTDRNAEQKEMKERTSRLYNRLEEVKRQKAEKERQDSYAANRQKKKEYEQKLQAKRRAKRTSSLEKTKKGK